MEKDEMSNGQTWMICGGSTFSNRILLLTALDVLAEQRGEPTLVVTGGGHGAGPLAQSWASRRGIKASFVKAPRLGWRRGDWRTRNAAMMARQPNLVVVFPGGKRTRDLVERASAEKIETIFAIPQSAGQ